MAGTDAEAPLPSGDTSEVAPEVEVDDSELLGQADWVIGGEAAAKAREPAPAPSAPRPARTRSPRWSATSTR